MQTGDVLYGTLLLVVGIAGYWLARSPANLLVKIVVFGLGFAALGDLAADDVQEEYLRSFDFAAEWLWPHLAPKVALMAGLGIAVVLMLRDHYAPMLSEVGVAVRRMKADAEADLDRQWREARAKLEREAGELGRRLDDERRDFQRRLEQEKEIAHRYVEQERAKMRQEHEQVMADARRAAAPDPYEVLGLASGAGAGEVRERYRKLATRCHPDTIMGNPDAIRELAEARMKEINAAYGRLRR